MDKTAHNILKGHVITLDGPSASGKATLATKLAGRYKLKYLDTGILYRCLTLRTFQTKISTDNIDAVIELAHEMEIDFKHVGNEKFATFLFGKNVAERIRMPEIDKIVRQIAPVQKVRDALRQRQIDYAEKWKDVYGVILDGRDTGGVIYPNADVQIFVKGDLKVRAYRRWLQMQNLGAEVSEEEVYRQMLHRDRQDAPNTIQTEKAFVLDVTYDNPESVEKKAVSYIEKALSE